MLSLVIWLFVLLLTLVPITGQPQDPLGYGYLGVSLSANMQVPVLASVTVDGPADLAGLRAGDQIVKIGRFQPRDQDTAIREIANCRPGSIVVLEILRKGEPILIKVRVTNRPDSLGPLPWQRIQP